MRRAVLPEVVSPVLIDWEPVTTSHPRIGKDGPVTISRYQFFVEQGDTKLSVDLPPTVTEFEIPTSITPQAACSSSRSSRARRRGTTRRSKLLPDAVSSPVVRVRTRIAGRRDQPRKEPLGETDRLAGVARDDAIGRAEVRAIQHVERFGERRETRAP